MLNDASVASAASYIRTCRRIRNSKKIATIRDFHQNICVNPTIMLMLWCEIWCNNFVQDCCLVNLNTIFWFIPTPHKKKYMNCLFLWSLKYSVIKLTADVWKDTFCGRPICEYGNLSYSKIHTFLLIIHGLCWQRRSHLMKLYMLKRCTHKSCCWLFEWDHNTHPTVV